jgi:uncharacterized lipoprotein YajG
MLNSQNQRQLWLAAVVMGLLTVAGCNQRATKETNQTTNPAPAAAQKTSAAKSVGVERAPAMKPAAASAKVTQAPRVVTVPKNTAITATVGETLTSEKNHTGDSFSARLSAPVEVDGKVVLAKGARVTGHVVKVKKNELRVALASIVVQGKSYDLQTNSVRPPDKSQAKNEAKLKTVAQSTKEKNDNSILPGQTQLTFKLAKPVTLSIKE